MYMFACICMYLYINTYINEKSHRPKSDLPSSRPILSDACLTTGDGYFG